MGIRRIKAEPGTRRVRRWPILVARLAALALVLGSGILQGKLTGRWGLSNAVGDASARLHRLPRSFGDWQGRDVPIDPRMIQVAEIQGYLARSYRNFRDGREVTVLLVCGRPGPIAVHTPDVCYEGQGFEVVIGPLAGTVGNGLDRSEMIRTRLRKPDAVAPEALDIFWSWNARGRWETPTSPRMSFASASVLHKLYLISRLEGDESAWPAEPRIPEEFAARIVSEIRRTCFARSELETPRPIVGDDRDPRRVARPGEPPGS